MLGAGKLGLPAALAIESRGHDVTVFDANPAVEGYFHGDAYPFKEAQVDELLADSQIKVAGSVGELVTGADIVFCAVQTPHEARYEGATPLGRERADFDYSHLKKAVVEVVEADQPTTLAVVSTCLPGTFEREISPLLSDSIDYVYNPLFIAMGTVVMDYLNPEFVLIGRDSEPAADKLQEFYATITDQPHVVTDIVTAEGIKVSYNTWITAKTVLANAWGEMCHKLGMDFDQMFKAWSLATDRIISPRYMNAGVGDGGACHPRDNIALSHLAYQVDASNNIWDSLMRAREDHMEWLAHTTYEASAEHGLPIVILGRAFKAESEIETGSAAILASNILKGHGVLHSHVEDAAQLLPAVYLVGTQHERYKDLQFPAGSVVIDPFRYLPERDGVKLVKIGGHND